MSNIQFTAEKIENINIQDLKVYEQNPKIHSDAQINQISNSIKEWGWTIPILIDEENVIIAGHGRYLAALNIDIKEVPCIRAVNWSEDKKRAYLIADNKLAENSSWDNGLLYTELKKISEGTFDLSLTGMEEEFSMMDFSPNFSPDISETQISSKDFESAKSKIHGEIDSAMNSKNQEGIEVICPHCSEQFYIAGY